MVERVVQREVRRAGGGRSSARRWFVVLARGSCSDTRRINLTLWIH